MEIPTPTLTDSAVLRWTPNGQQELMREARALPDTALRLLARVNGFTELQVFIRLGPEDGSALLPAAEHLLNLGLVEDVR